MAENAMNSEETYDSDKDMSLVKPNDGVSEAAREMVFFKGQSKRLFNELYKVFVCLYSLLCCIKCW